MIATSAHAGPLSCAIAATLLLAVPAHAQSGGQGGGNSGTAAGQASPAGAQPPSPPSAQPSAPPGAQPSSPAGVQPPSPAGAQPPTPQSGETNPATQPSYPSTSPPRGTTPQQRRQLQQQGALGTDSNAVTCNQEDELARNECLRRDMTDDDLPAGVTPSMQQRRQERQSAQSETTPPSEADPRSDEAGVRSRTRTASSSTSERTETERQPEPASETNSDTEDAVDTLGPER